MKDYTIKGRQVVGVGDTFAVGKDFFKLESIESGTAIVRRSGTNDTFTYGVEMLRRTLRTVGYELEDYTNGDTRGNNTTVSTTKVGRK